jgi:hypothetical protein
MNERGFDRMAEAYLADGPTVLADRVLDAALGEVHVTRQQRARWRAPWRFPDMSTFAKVAVAAVAVIAVGLVGMTFLQPGGNGGVGAPSAAPSPTVVPTAPPDPTDAVTSSAPTAPPLTGAFTSPSHGYTISYPDTWETRPATAPWTTQWVDWFNESGDLLHDAGAPGALFLSLASQPLGDRTRAEWEADVDEILAVDDPAGPPCSSAAAQITIDGAPGIRCGKVALVTEGGRGYWIMLYTSNDGPWLGEANEVAWFESVLATMELHPEDAVDAAASPAPS